MTLYQAECRTPSPGMTMCFRKMPSNVAPIPRSAVRDRSLFESVLNSTRRQPSRSNACPSMSSFASRFAPVRCQAGATQVQPISRRRCSRTRFMYRVEPIARPDATSIVANGSSRPASRAAIVSAAHARSSSSLVGRAIVSRQISGSRATSARRGTWSNVNGSRRTRRPSSVIGSRGCGRSLTSASYASGRLHRSLPGRLGGPLRRFL
jgi:hypothetical protein